jgi:hypothetical protein
MDDGAMADMRTLAQHHRSAGKEVDRTALLYVAAVFDDDSPPVTADGGAGTDIDIPADQDIARDGRLGMYKSRRMDHRSVAIEFVKHIIGQ